MHRGTTNHRHRRETGDEDSPVALAGTDLAREATVNPKTVPHRPLGLVINMLEEAGLVYSYCYEDLVFVESSIVLFRMGEIPEEVFLYASTECPEKTATDLQIRLALAAKKEGLTLIPSGKYEIQQGEDQKINLKFHPATSG